jgi:hypothetical protein
MIKITSKVLPLLMVIVIGMLLQMLYIQHTELDKLKINNNNLRDVITTQKGIINSKDSLINFLNDDNQILSSYLGESEFKQD